MVAAWPAQPCRRPSTATTTADGLPVHGKTQDLNDDGGGMARPAQGKTQDLNEDGRGMSAPTAPAN